MPLAFPTVSHHTSNISAHWNTKQCTDPMRSVRGQISENSARLSATMILKEGIGSPTASQKEVGDIPIPLPSTPSELQSKIRITARACKRSNERV